MGAKYDANRIPPYNDAYRAHAAIVDSERTALYVIYKVKFDGLFNSNGADYAGKLPGLAGTRKGGGGGIKSDGKNGWSAVVAWRQLPGGAPQRDSLVLYGYAYHKNQPESTGHNLPTLNEHPPKIKKGEWYRIKTWVKMNTPGQADGQFKLWIRPDATGTERLRVHADGNTIKVYNELGVLDTTISLVGPPTKAIEYSDSTTIKINRLFAYMYFGGVETSPNTSYIYLDSIVANDYGGFPKPVADDTYLLPSNSISLEQNTPNPFNPETAIHYTLLNQGPVELKVYNLAGQEVRTLVNDVLSAGRYEVVWEGTDNAGLKVASGVYLYQLKVEGVTKTKKMILLH